VELAVSAPTDGARPPDERQPLDRVVVRIAGDSGDGIQVTGGQLTATSALAGNDIATLPDFPAEIRAPAGTLPGVSGFQLQFSASEIMTPGDQADVLVAFNPAALKVHLRDLKRGGIVIVNEDAFDENGLRKAGYAANPLDDGTLASATLHRVAISRLTREALTGTGLGAKDAERCKNFFALGMLYWLYGRPIEPTARWIRDKYTQRPELAGANEKVLRAGFNYGNTVRIFQSVYHVPPARLEPGLYRNLDGNEAIALALAGIAQRSGMTVVLGSYPITPASTVLHACSRLKSYGVIAYQAEDEIASIGAALGAAFAGALGVTTTSGPGLALKGETLGLATMVELPLVVFDIQRAGPSTGMPTKTEQSDLLMALFGRHGEAPLPVLAPATPGDCFWITIEAARIAVRYRTPVIVLSEGYLASGSEPFRVPRPEEIPALDPGFLTEKDRYAGAYARDPSTLARPWIPAGTPGLQHRVGGLEKDDLGQVSYDAQNHQRMVALRAGKVAGIAADIPPARLEEGAVGDDLLVVGWGSTYGAITQAVREERAAGRRVASLHLRHLNPLPRGLGELLAAFPRVLVPELNTGQLLWLLSARFHLDAVGFHKVQGAPFRVGELRVRIAELLGA
jgi:2-oxoglutarate ferredoxin oxidoreductase subunit alpha